MGSNPFPRLPARSVRPFPRRPLLTLRRPTSTGPGPSPGPSLSVDRNFTLPDRTVTTSRTSVPDTSRASVTGPDLPQVERPLVAPKTVQIVSRTVSGQSPTIPPRNTPETPFPAVPARPETPTARTPPIVQGPRPSSTGTLLPAVRGSLPNRKYLPKVSSLPRASDRGGPVTPRQGPSGQSPDRQVNSTSRPSFSPTRLPGRSGPVPTVTRSFVRFGVKSVTRSLPKVPGPGTRSTTTPPASTDSGQPRSSLPGRSSIQGRRVRPPRSLRPEKGTTAVPSRDHHDQPSGLHLDNRPRVPRVTRGRLPVRGLGGPKEVNRLPTPNPRKLVTGGKVLSQTRADTTINRDLPSGSPSPDGSRGRPGPRTSVTRSRTSGLPRRSSVQTTLGLIRQSGEKGGTMSQMVSLLRDVAHGIEALNKGNRKEPKSQRGRSSGPRQFVWTGESSPSVSDLIGDE